MKYTAAIAIALLAYGVSAAQARNGDGPSNNNGPTFGGTTNNNITNQGGAGGRGGDGGTGIGFGGNAHAGAAASAGAAAGAVANNRNSVRSTNVQGQAQGQRQSASGGNSTVNYSAPGDVRYSGTYTVRNTPDVYAPALHGGANPCVVGASVGGAGAGFGFSFGLTTNDAGCERRNVAIVLTNMGQQDAALEVMCRDSDVRAALLAVGRPCTADRPRVQSVSVPAAATLPVVTPIPQPQRNRPAYCDNLLARGLITDDCR